jgi:hypothetical protein
MTIICSKCSAELHTDVVKFHIETLQPLCDVCFKNTPNARVTIYEI